MKRRALLKFTTLFVTSVVVSASVNVWLPKNRDIALNEKLKNKLLQLFSSLKSARAVGFEYLRSLPSEMDGEELLSHRWSSWVVPFDDIDFEKRDWVPYSGWPFGKETLMPYYERANSICGISDFDYEPVHSAEKIGKPDFRLMPLKGSRIKSKIWRFHYPPVNWKDAYLEELQSANNIKIYLNSNVVEIETNDVANQVTRVRVACVNNNQFWVTSKVFVLAMGGVEIPRVLLASNKTQKAGLGNQNDLVGRFFMEHPSYDGFARTMIADREDYPALYTLDSESRREYGVIAGLSPSREFQEKAKILNSATLMFHARGRWTSASVADGFLEHVGAVLTDLGTRGYLGKRLFGRFDLHTHLRRLLDFRPQIEQAPNPDSRITLSEEKDLLGLNQSKLDWRLTELDRHTLHTVNKLLAEEIGQSGLGRAQILSSETDTHWPLNYGFFQGIKGPSMVGGWHFTGTTRMHDDSKQGVVDANCKVHGIGNLYIASSSVFPTNSFANPTLTIIALTLRLAEHINSQFPSI